MNNEYQLLLINIVLALLSFALGMWLAPHVHAQAPGLPFQVYGTVTDTSGNHVPEVSVEAYIKGIVVATSTTNSEGMYGIKPNMLIITDPSAKYAGQIVTFTVRGSAVPQKTTFQPGSLTDLELTADSQSATSSSTIKNMPESTSTSAAIINASQSVDQTPPEGRLIFGLSTSTPVPAKYRGDILHLEKGHAQYYKTVNPSYYEHTGILGTSAGLLVIILLVWVFYQNYRHAKSKK